MNLNEIRIAVRAQLDVDDEELPNRLIDLYTQDGFDRIINLETRWPFYERRWDAVATDGEAPVPATAREIDSLMIDGQGGRLERIDQLHAERMFLWPNSSGTAQFWSLMGTTIMLHPGPSGETLLRLRGFRKPLNWVGTGASGEVDADDRLHLPLIWYVCALAYAQQEDEVLEQTYMNRFSESVALAQASVMRVWSGEPKIFNSYRYPQYQTRQPSVVLNVPPTNP